MANQEVHASFDGHKATLYYVSEFLGNIVKLEIKLHDIGQLDYAQYKNVPYVTFKKKRASNMSQYFVSYKPNWLVVEGWGHPEPASTEVLLREDADVRVTTYNCSISEPQKFDALLSQIPDEKILKYVF